MAIVGLGALVAICVPIAEGTNTLAAIATGVVFIGAPALYFAPAWAAHMRDHPKTTSIFIVDLFLGWTLIGWVGALAWAFAGGADPDVAE